MLLAVRPASNDLHARRLSIGQCLFASPLRLPCGRNHSINVRVKISSVLERKALRYARWHRILAEGSLPTGGSELAGVGEAMVDKSWLKFALLARVSDGRYSPWGPQAGCADQAFRSGERLS